MIPFLKKLAPIVMHLLFWSWNAMFISVVVFGLLPFVLGPLFIDVLEGFTPLDFALTSLALMVVPVLCTIAGFARLRTRPDKLFALLYGVEGPIMLLLFVRLFLVRELTAATTYMLLMLMAGGLVYAAGIFWPAPTKPGRAAAAFHLTTHGVLLVAGLYLAALISFYAVPAGAAVIDYLISFEWVTGLGRMFRDFSFSTALYSMIMVVLMLALFALTSAMFAVMPLVLVVLYLSRWRGVYRAARSALGPVAPALLTLAFVGLAVLGFVRTNQQPQRAVLARLEKPPVTDAERRALLADREQIREGLLNAYLSPYRYVGPAQSDHHVAAMFHRTVGLSEEDAQVVQDLYGLLARPMMYDGADDASSTYAERNSGRGPARSGADERQRAADLYAAFFDEPIQKGEKDTVLRALNATFDRSGREAGLLDEGGRKVHLERQDLVVTERGTHAEIELHEVYANQTYEQQEIFYDFSLPESAVITGLWLGDTDDRARRFPYVVATRGAAQAVYKAEVQRRVDPALLEQIGPRQYRLRAFPIPAKLRSRVDATSGPDRMHLWMTFQVLPDDATWPLPRLIERRNVFADADTERSLNGGRLTVADAADWLPREVPALGAITRADTTITLTATAAVRAQPLPAQRPTLPPGKRFAVVLDRSYSMGAHVDALGAAFDWMASELEPQHELDLYFTSGQGRGESAVRIDQPRGFDPHDVVYFGGQDPTGMLADFAALRGDTRYDAIIFLTDEGSYALAKDTPGPRDLGAPVWFVHVGGALPVGYDDATLELIQASGGGVTTALPRVFLHMAYAAQSPDFIAVDDHYVWSRAAPAVNPTDRAEASAPVDVEASAPVDGRPGMQALAARQHLVAATRTRGPLDLPTLDALHALARRFSIVTPYSSMLVLVNDAQRQALAAAEAQDDRFDREVETGTETLSTPAGGFPVITATPEPEEWALIIVVALGLGLIARQRRLTPARTSWPAA